MEREQVCSDDDFESVPSDPLPNVLDTLSSELSPELAAKRDAKRRQPEKEKVVVCRNDFEPSAIVTPVKSNAEEEDDDECKTYHYRSGLSDDFDLFDGGLLRATEDEVLKNL